MYADQSLGIEVAGTTALAYATWKPAALKPWVKVRMPNLPASLSPAISATDLPRAPPRTAARPSGQVWLSVPPGVGTRQPLKP